MPRAITNSSLEPIGEFIHLLRGQRVMLDFDLAALYGVETKVLNQAVRRNRERFPADFMFQLSREATGFALRSHIVTSKSGAGGRRYRPDAFTEQGVAMLSSVLRSVRAVRVNIEIMRAFVKLRQMLASSAVFSRRLDDLERKYDRKFSMVFAAIRELTRDDGEAGPKREIGFHASLPAENPKTKMKRPQPRSS